MRLYGLAPLLFDNTSDDGDNTGLNTGGGGGSSSSFNPNSFITSLFGAGAGALAGNLNQNQQNGARDYISNIGNVGQGASNQGVNSANNAFNPAQWANAGVLNGQSPLFQQFYQALGGNSAAQGNQANLLSSLPGLISGAGAQNLPDQAGMPSNLLYQDSNMEQAQRDMTNQLGATGGLENWASQMINAGGITDTQGPYNQYAQNLMSGNTTNQQALSGAGNNVLASGGMSPALQAAMNQAMGVVQGGGQTDLTNKLAQTGLNLANVNGGNPLLTMGQAAGFATDQSGRNFANAATQARTQAMQRGQGPGDVVAGGAGNDALRDNSDAALAGTANAAQTALMGQQGLNLQQLAQGLNTSLSAADIQRSLELGGLGSVAGLQNSGTQALGTGGGLTMDSSSLANQGANNMMNLLGLQQSNLQQGLNAGTSAINQTQGITQADINNLMSGQMNSANLGQMLATLQQQGIGQQGSLAQGQANIGATGLGTQQAAANSNNTQGGDWLGYGQTGLNTQAGTASAMSKLFGTQSPTGQSTANAGAGGIGQALGSILGLFL